MFYYVLCCLMLKCVLIKTWDFLIFINCQTQNDDVGFKSEQLGNHCNIKCASAHRIGVRVDHRIFRHNLGGSLLYSSQFFYKKMSCSIMIGVTSDWSLAYGVHLGPFMGLNRLSKTTCADLSGLLLKYKYVRINTHASQCAQSSDFGNKTVNFKMIMIVTIQSLVRIWRQSDIFFDNDCDHNFLIEKRVFFCKTPKFFKKSKGSPHE